MSAAAVVRQPGPQVRMKGRSQLAVQARFVGAQDLRVACQTAELLGRSHGAISVRVGQVLLYLEDPEALFSWVAAIQRAVELQDQAFGVTLPPARYLPPAA